MFCATGSIIGIIGIILLLVIQVIIHGHIYRLVSEQQRLLDNDKTLIEAMRERTE